VNFRWWEVGSGKWEVGSGKWEAGSWKLHSTAGSVDIPQGLLYEDSIFQEISVIWSFPNRDTPME